MIHSESLNLFTFGLKPLEKESASFVNIIHIAMESLSTPSNSSEKAETLGRNVIFLVNFDHIWNRTFELRQDNKRAPPSPAADSVFNMTQMVKPDLVQGSGL